MNYDHKLQRYVNVRMNKGEGVRQESFKCDATLKVIQEAKEAIFFLMEKLLLIMLKNLVKFFHRTVANCNGVTIFEVEKLKLRDYVNQHKLAKTRLHLLTK